MTSPEEAIARARAEAASRRAEGSYPQEAPGSSVPDVADGLSSSKLFEWAMIDPDPSVVRSTRRMGAPIGAFKRLLLRLLVQYHAEQNAQQTRFNVHVAAALNEVDRRLRELEQPSDAER